MKIVIAGDRGMEGKQSVDLVYSIIDMCKEKYPKLRIVTKGTDRGIGKIIRTRLLDPTTRQPRELDWTEVWIQHHLVNGDLSKIEFSSDYDSLNSALVEMGDEFHILSEEKPRGVTINLLRRILAANRPYALYKPSDLEGKTADFPKEETKW